MNWVSRCIRGLRNSCSPAIQDLAGENVCIQVITPAQLSSALASLNVARIMLLVSSVGLSVRGKGKRPEALMRSTMTRACSATCSRHSAPYRSCEPTQNQNVYCLPKIIIHPPVLEIIHDAAPRPQGAAMLIYYTTARVNGHQLFEETNHVPAQRRDRDGQPAAVKVSAPRRHGGHIVRVLLGVDCLDVIMVQQGMLDL